jgi:hypothetical protein
MPSENTGGRSGPLHNGNPRGDPNLAPRCGAKTGWPRSVPCRAAAMANGRCRMHGGRSAGPRTAEGLARIRAARTAHGFYTAESKAARRYAAAIKAEARAELVRRRAAEVVAATRALLALQRAGAHPVDAIVAHRLRVVVGKVPVGGRAAGRNTLCNVRKAKG